MTPVTPSSVCDMQGESEQFEAHLKTAAWHQVLVQAKDDDDDGASIYRMCRMASREAWTAARASLAERTQQEALTDEPDAYLFAVRHPQPRPRYEEFAALDWYPGIDDKRVLISKKPLYLARPTSAANSTAPMQPSETEKAALEVAWCWGQYGWEEETRLAIERMCAVLAGKASSYSAPSVEAVENEVGMGAGAWDTIKPESIIAAVLKLAALAAPTQATMPAAQKKGEQS